MLPTEYQEQVAFVQWLKLKKLPFWHTPNSTYTKSWKQKATNAAMGVQSGIPDVFVCVAGRVVGVEMKRVKGGVVSPTQKQWIETLTEHGIESRVCKGATQAINFIKEIQNET